MPLVSVAVEGLIWHELRLIFDNMNKKYGFPLRISLVNVNKSTVLVGLAHIY